MSVLDLSRDSFKLTLNTQKIRYEALQLYLLRPNSALEVPHYKFYSLIVVELLLLRKRYGTDVKEAFRELKKASQNDYKESCNCLLYTSPSPRDGLLSRMPSSA